MPDLGLDFQSTQPVLILTIKVLQMTIDKCKQQISLNVKTNANIATRWHCCHMTVCADAIYSDWKSQSCCLQGQLSSSLDRRNCFQFLYVGHLHIRVRTPTFWCHSSCTEKQKHDLRLYIRGVKACPEKALRYSALQMDIHTHTNTQSLVLLLY